MELTRSLCFVFLIDGTWEEVSIAQPEALADLDDLEDEPEEVEAVRSAKGKERA